MKQRVKPISYLAKVEIDFASVGNTSYEAVALPEGAELLHISLEVTEAGESGAKADLGFKDSTAAIADDVDISKVGTNIAGFVGSTKSITSLTFTPSAAQSKGRGILRVFYVLPSEILAEY